MASIEEQLRNVRTLEDIVNLLTILFTNLNNQNEQYYDMFLNPVPMDLNLERYDENGELVTVVHPNVAKMKMTAYSGEGNPNGKVVANAGSLYIDLLEPHELFYKASGSNSQGWYSLWSKYNLVSGVNFLTPTSEAPELRKLNMNNAGLGKLSVEFGGTGVSSISGIVKGNGTEPFEAATDGVDYMGPSSFTGMIAYYPADIIPDGWLICDGKKYDVASSDVNLSRLCTKLGTKYRIVQGSQGTYYAFKYDNDNIVYTKSPASNLTVASVVYSEVGVASMLAIRSISGNIITLSDGKAYTYTSASNIDASSYEDTDVDGVTKFRVPNLIGKYIKGGALADVGVERSGHLGAHTHGVVGNTAVENAHTHDRGNMNIIGHIPASENVYKSGYSLPSPNCFSKEAGNVISGTSVNDKFDNDVWLFNAASTWEGRTGATSHLHGINLTSEAAGSGANEVDHIIMVPVIKY